MKRNVRSAFSYAAALILASAAFAACGELTGPESPSTPTDVKAVLLTVNSAKITWTPSPLNDGVISYTIFRNGNKLGESTTTEFTDTGLAQQTTYVYSVAANCKGGIVSDRSAETTQSTVTTVDITPPRVVATNPLNDGTGVARAGTSTVTFSEPMDPATITTSTFNLRVTSTGQILAGTVTYNTTTRVAEFIPSSPLPNSTKVTVTVTAGAKDLAGNALSPVFTASWTTRDEEGPTVTSTTPANNAQGVSVNTTISITFSEAVQASTINTTNLSLRVTSPSTNVAGIVAFNGTNVATFTPSAPLTSGTNYTFTVNSVRDIAGNAMAAPVTFNFTVGDATPPVVASTVPVENASGVSPSAAISATFNEAMDANTITTSTFTVRPTVGAANVAGIVSYNSSTLTATFTPSLPLADLTAYTVTITTAVTDAAGNHLGATKTWTFATRDETPPTVVSFLPANGADSVPANATVQVTFNEPMDASSITASTIVLRVSGASAAVPATVVYNSITKVATLAPSAPLSDLTNYTITVTTAVKDASDNPLAVQRTSTFTTGTRPSVFSTTPVNGSTVAAPLTITVTFTEPMNAATITSSTFSVKKTSDNSAVGGIVTYDAPTRTARFQVNTPPGLAAGTSYTVTVTTGAQDVAGNPLTSNFSFSFNTSGP